METRVRDGIAQLSDRLALDLDDALDAVRHRRQRRHNRRMATAATATAIIAVAAGAYSVAGPGDGGTASSVSANAPASSNTIINGGTVPSEALWPYAIGTLGELFNRSELVVFAEPTGVQRELLVTETGSVRIASFRVLEASKGNASIGTEIDVALWAPEPSNSELALDGPLYLLGLTSSSYGTEIWSSLSGPNSVVAFDLEAGVYIATAKPEPTPLGVTLAGDSLEQVREAIRTVNS